MLYEGFNKKIYVRRKVWIYATHPWIALHKAWIHALHDDLRIACSNHGLRKTNGESLEFAQTMNFPNYSVVTKPYMCTTLLFYKVLLDEVVECSSVDHDASILPHYTALAMDALILESPIKNGHEQ